MDASGRLHADGAMQWSREEGGLMAKKKKEKKTIDNLSKHGRKRNLDGAPVGYVGP